jgi:hypothetical protein
MAPFFAAASNIYRALLIGSRGQPIKRALMVPLGSLLMRLENRGSAYLPDMDVGFSSLLRRVMVMRSGS